MSGVHTCPYCGCVNEPHEDFCADCGMQISMGYKPAASSICPQCAAENAIHAKVCVNCKSKLKKPPPLWIIIPVVVVLAIFIVGKFIWNPFGSDFARGKKALENNLFTEAIYYLNVVIAKDDENAEAYLKLAEAYEALGDMQDARDILEEGYSNTGNNDIADKLATYAALKQEPVDILLEFPVGQVIMFADSVKMALSSSIIIKDENTMLPARSVFENIGGAIDYDLATSTVQIDWNQSVVDIIVDSSTAYINGNPVRLTIAPTVIDGMLYIPARLFEEAYSASIKWNGDTETVSIRCPIFE